MTTWHYTNCFYKRISCIFMAFYWYVKVCYFSSKLSLSFCNINFNNLTSVLILDLIPHSYPLHSWPWAGQLCLIELPSIDNQLQCYSVLWNCSLHVCYSRFILLYWATVRNFKNIDIQKYIELFSRKSDLPTTRDNNRNNWCRRVFLDTKRFRNAFFLLLM